jgi:hypothetical protein
MDLIIIPLESLRKATKTHEVTNSAPKRKETVQE